MNFQLDRLVGIDPSLSILLEGADQDVCAAAQLLASQSGLGMTVVDATDIKAQLAEDVSLARAVMVQSAAQLFPDIPNPHLAPFDRRRPELSGTQQQRDQAWEAVKGRPFVLAITGFGGELSPLDRKGLVSLRSDSRPSLSDKTVILLGFDGTIEGGLTAGIRSRLYGLISVRGLAKSSR